MTGVRCSDETSPITEHSPVGRRVADDCYFDWLLSSCRELIMLGVKVIPIFYFPTFEGKILQ